MNFTDLSFEPEQMIAGLRMWVETESPSTDADAVNRVLDLATYEMVTLGARIERIPGRAGCGDSLRATFNAQRNDQPGVLICCHVDTVHAVGSIDSMPYRREGNKLWGPGVLGMKAGIYLALEVLKKMFGAGWQPKIPVSFLFLADKELGCPTTRELLEVTAQNNRYVLVPEPATSEGGVCWGRHAVTWFNLDYKINASHSHSVHGTEDLQSSADRMVKPQSTIVEMARHLIDINAMDTDTCCFSVSDFSSIEGHRGMEKCTAQVIAEACTENAFVHSSDKMLALNSPNPDKGLHVNRGELLPLWLPQEQDKSLYAQAHAIASQLSVDLPVSVAGGGSLGNITGACGIATLDALGPRGSGLRTSTEHIEIDSLAERGKLIAGLLASLDQTSLD